MSFELFALWAVFSLVSCRLFIKVKALSARVEQLDKEK